ncbi:MAG: hypothetical protein JXA46_18050 [Dehalococcoidales bacterium]|nr:hypothetical protein [Dehalococcoidales bacterium]
MKTAYVSCIALIAVIFALISFPLTASAQDDWGSQQPIQDNASVEGYTTQVALSGANAVAVWY